MFAINARFGGFNLSKEARTYLKEVCGWDADKIWDAEYYENLNLRSDPDLIDAVTKFPHPTIALRSVPDGATDVRIFEYDGLETLWFVLDGKMVRA